MVWCGASHLGRFEFLDPLADQVSRGVGLIGYTLPLCWSNERKGDGPTPGIDQRQGTLALLQIPTAGKESDGEERPLILSHAYSGSGGDNALAVAPGGRGENGDTGQAAGDHHTQPHVTHMAMMETAKTPNESNQLGVEHQRTDAPVPSQIPAAGEDNDGVKISPALPQAHSGSEWENTPDVTSRGGGENGTKEKIKSAHHNKEVPGREERMETQDRPRSTTTLNCMPLIWQ